MNIKQCPHCKTGVQTTCLFTTQIGESEHAGIYRCPACEEIIFITGHVDFEYGEQIYKIDQMYPQYKDVIEFSESIAKISSQFVETYNQAHQADLYKLNEVSGGGYRKSLEILIKDFAIYLTPDKKDDIIQDNKLSNVINNRIPNKIHFDEIKDFANRSWWLGSDESHYYKKYDQSELNELKTCIDIVVTEIDYYVKRDSLRDKIIKK